MQHTGRDGRLYVQVLSSSKQPPRPKDSSGRLAAPSSGGVTGGRAASSTDLEARGPVEMASGSLCCVAGAAKPRRAHSSLPRQALSSASSLAARPCVALRDVSSQTMADQGGVPLQLSQGPPSSFKASAMRVGQPCKASQSGKGAVPGLKGLCCLHLALGRCRTCLVCLWLVARDGMQVLRHSSVRSLACSGRGRLLNMLAVHCVHRLQVRLCQAKLQHSSSGSGCTEARPFWQQAPASW